MKRIILSVVLAIGMIATTQAQDKSYTNGIRGYAFMNVNADIDSAETYTVEVLLNTASQPKAYLKGTIDSISGTGKCAIYRYGKLFQGDTPTYIDTITYAGGGSDTTFKFSSASVLNYRYLGVSIKGTGGSVTFDELEIKTWE